jgi:hypothetical protein
MKTININNPTYFSAHRSGWGYVMNGLMKFHNRDSILLDDFIDITFGYNFELNLSKKIIPYKKPWIGFLHHPPKICPWYDNNYRASIDIHNFLNSDIFLTSLEHCRGIFVLSEYLKNYLINNFKQFKNIPIFVLKHPTEFGLYEWNFNKFKTFYNDTGIKLLSIGYFLRNLSTIFNVYSTKKIDKILLPSHLEMAIDNLEREISYKNIDIDKTRVKILNWQDNNFYDKILEQSIVLLDLYDTSCNNAIIESVIRNTPLIINKHPAVIEYLGKNYPSYFTKYDQIQDLLTYDSIQSSAEYLQNLSKSELTIDYFKSEFQKCLSDIDITTTKKSKKITVKSPDNLLIKESKFTHRFGWSWVISNLKQNNTIINHKSNNNLYCNDFIDHTFRNDNDNKSILLNNKRYGLIRGYNLFSYNNTDIFLNDEIIYQWNITSNSWEPINNNNILESDINFQKIQTYKLNKWIGFLHNPINMPRWFDYNQNIKLLLHNKDFIESLENCELIFVLSEHLKDEIAFLFDKYNIDVPIRSLKHPVPKMDKSKTWKYDMFLETKTIIQAGYWMRKMHSFWELETNLNKIWLYGDRFAGRMLDIENIVLGKKDTLSHDDIRNSFNLINTNTSGKIKDVYITSVNDQVYDKLLQSSLIYVNFYDCAASNSIVECISSQTPILVNKLPSVVEYLGEDYPLYFRDINHASSLSNNTAKILEAHEYLKENTKLIDQLNIEKFIESFYRECNKICKK